MTWRECPSLGSALRAKFSEVNRTMSTLIRRTTGLPVNLAYLDVGQGSPVIFVHEFAGDMMSWLPQVNALSRRYRCIAYSARGYTPSDIRSLTRLTAARSR